jgi:predicted AAA+ superfamily ATPase
MKLKHRELIIDPNKPFLNCKLKREKYAHVLTQIVANYADGFVLAINNEWGSGKTTFVKMWQQQLNNQSFRTLYFNAWENDYESDPMVALLAELKSLTKKKNIYYV